MATGNIPTKTAAQRARLRQRAAVRRHGMETAAATARKTRKVGNRGNR